MFCSCDDVKPRLCVLLKDARCGRARCEPGASAPVRAAARLPTRGPLNERFRPRGRHYAGKLIRFVKFFSNSIVETSMNYSE